MKAGIITFITILFIGITSCSNDSNLTIKDSIIGIVKNGTWRITYYWDSDHEETDNFTGYNFTFGPSDVLTTTNGANTYTGTWSITESNSNEDSLNDLDFNIAFATPASFAELSDDWEIIQYSGTKIQLQDVSGGGGGTDYLTFERN